MNFFFILISPLLWILHSVDSTPPSRGSLSADGPRAVTQNFYRGQTLVSQVSITLILSFLATHFGKKYAKLIRIEARLATWRRRPKDVKNIYTRWESTARKTYGNEGLVKN
jgi:hypothetical protein